MKTPAALFVLAALPLSAQADKPFHAESFHQQKCTACHDASVYTRAHRRVNSRGQLESQVRMCDASLGLRLFDEDLRALADYLDQNYYGFGK